jgi:regulator of replication initiation timing
MSKRQEITIKEECKLTDENDNLREENKKLRQVLAMIRLATGSVMYEGDRIAVGQIEED